MKKITGIYLADPSKRRGLGGGQYATGLVLEDEDGTRYLHNSADLIAPFERVKTHREKVTRIIDWLRSKTGVKS